MSTILEAVMEKAMEKQLRRSAESQLGEGLSMGLRDFGISVKGGVVTVSGFVLSEAERVAAEKAAKSVYGVDATASIVVTPDGRTRSRDPHSTGFDCLG